MPSRLTHLECSRCGRTHYADKLHNRCECGGTLLSRYDLEKLDLEVMRARPPGTWRYEELLPLRSPPVSLGEPETALLFLPRISERLGVETWIKDDGTLPGGTFKARGACVGLSRAVELGVKRVVMPTAGNAGGTWSLYAARAGIEITVTMAKSAPLANQTEVCTAGGNLVLVDGTIADAATRAAEIAADTDGFLATTFNEPYRMEGKKAAWFEAFDRMGDEDAVSIPRTIVLPVGGGVAAIAAAKAVEEVRKAGWTHDAPPKVIGVQPANCSPIVRAFEAGLDEVEPWSEDPYTIAAGLRVPAPAEGALVLRTVRESGGAMASVTEEEILDAVRELASTEGVFACPEGAASLAAAHHLASEGGLEEPVLLYNTGSGAKYVDALA